MALYLRESLTFDSAKMEILSEDSPSGGKTLTLKGVCI